MHGPYYCKTSSRKMGCNRQAGTYLCAAGRIKDVKRTGRSWLIPADAPKPEDGRVSRFRNNKLKELLSRIDEKKTALDWQPRTNGTTCGRLC